MNRSSNFLPPDEKFVLSLELTEAEMNELTSRFPGTDLSVAGSLVIKSELDRRYRLERKAGELAFLRDRKVQKKKD